MAEDKSEADKVIEFADQILGTPLLPWQCEFVRTMFSSDPGTRMQYVAPGGPRIGRTYVARVIERYRESHGSR